MLVLVYDAAPCAVSFAATRAGGGLDLGDGARLSRVEYGHSSVQSTNPSCGRGDVRALDGRRLRRPRRLWRHCFVGGVYRRRGGPTGGTALRPESSLVAWTASRRCDSAARQRIEKAISDGARNRRSRRG